MNRSSETQDLTPGDLAEIAGAHIGHGLLNAMLSADSQAARLRALHAALIDAADSTERGRTLGGLAVVLVNVLEQGLCLMRQTAATNDHSAPTNPPTKPDGKGACR